MEKYSIITTKYINNGKLFHFMSIDKKDKAIIDVLKENSKLTTSQISKKLNIPITTVHNRIKKLINQEIIKNYTIKINHKKFGNPILAYILASVTYISISKEKLKQEDIAKKIKSLQEVEEVNIMAGVTDLLIKVRIEDIDQLNMFIIDKLRAIDGVDKTETMIVLSEL